MECEFDTTNVRGPKGTRESTVLVGDTLDLETTLPVLSGFGIQPNPIGIMDLADTLCGSSPPTMIASVAISNSFDCYDVAQILAFQGYTGMFRILPVGLAKPKVVIDEARRQFPDLDIDLLREPARLKTA